MLRIFTLLIKVNPKWEVYVFLTNISFHLLCYFFVISLLFLFLGAETYEYTLQGSLTRVYAH